MQYLYHHLPNDLQGDVLYPLNELKSRLPDVYAKEFSKYTGREHITRQRIPVLNDCLWNDVLFLTALNPQELFDARREAGWHAIAPQKYLKIDPNTLDTTKLGIFLFNVKPDDADTSLGVDDFTAYNYDDLRKYATVPEATKDYFRHELKAGAPRIRLFYRYVPHILYRGPISVANAEIITVH